jgi:hydroxymethylpyrimidine/phosphomethylpyrimidine kinase
LLKEATLLTIAGSDPSGGAGIQADLKTMTTVGVYGAAAITCLTVQNSLGVQGMYPLDPDFVERQIQSVLDDHFVTHIKIGMLGSLKIVQMIQKILLNFEGTVVFDPVLAATTGESLLQGDGLELLKTKLLAYISYLTPNRNELESLTGKSVQTVEGGIGCANVLLEKYPKMEGIIVKGGHFDTENTNISDILILQNGGQIESKRQRIASSNLHGTGCTYSTALSSYLLQGYGIEAAFKKTGDYMGSIIQAGLDRQITKSNTNGPLIHHLYTKH